MSGSADVIVLGGGPAGTAAAIWGAAAGLRVILLERAASSRFRPGETLHPGSIAILQQLGVAEAVIAASPIRPDGQVVVWGDSPRFVAYGRDGRGPWRAYQISRDILDDILTLRARQLGVHVHQAAPRFHLVTHGRRIAGIRTELGDLFRAPFIIDATGSAGWLRRMLGIGIERHSPTLFAFYGYVRGTVSPLPRLEGDPGGWTWTAQVQYNLVHWCRLDFRRPQERPTAPETLWHCAAAGRVRAADVTWRRAASAAGPGYFLVGDAASVLDPAASHGVLKAMMSGMKAVQLVADVLKNGTDAVTAAAHYDSWIEAWFRHDVSRLSRLYEKINRGWAHWEACG